MTTVAGNRLQPEPGTLFRLQQFRGISLAQVFDIPVKLLCIHCIEDFKMKRIRLCFYVPCNVTCYFQL